jgi:hypothetical protein
MLPLLEFTDISGEFREICSGLEAIGTGWV